MGSDLSRYLTGMLHLAYQEKIYNVTTKNIPADSTYKDLQTLGFKIKWPANQYMNWNSIHICLSIIIKIETNETNNKVSNLITVNSLFVFFLLIG